MKIQTKIILLLSVIIAMYMAGLYFIRESEAERQKMALKHQEQKALNLLTRVIAMRQSSLDGFAASVGSICEGAGLLNRNDPKRSSLRIDQKSLVGANATGLWVCGRDVSVAYSITAPEAEGLGDLPVPAEVRAQVFAQGPEAHFFMSLPQGPMEMAAVAVIPTDASGGEKTPAGYVFAGRLWNASYIAGLRSLSECNVWLEPAASPARVASVDGPAVLSRELPGWDGKPGMRFNAEVLPGTKRDMDQAPAQQFLLLVVFAIVMLGVLFVFLMRWVTRPTALLSKALNAEDPKLIQSLVKQNTEFGELAVMIDKFFEQRGDLLTEITERRSTTEALRQSEEQLRQSQKMEAVGRLAGGIAHDFNNLLTAIVGHAELLIIKLAQNPLRVSAEEIKKAGSRAATLVHQLLAFSRKQILQPKVIDLNHLVSDMDKLLRRVIGEHIDLVTELDPQIKSVKADPGQMEQVVMNLVVNARDAMPSGGRVTIETGNVDVKEDFDYGHGILPKGEYVLISVKDTGTGMSGEVQARIFEPFFTTKEPGKGTGLGLSTVYGIVQQSGGHVIVRSELNKGTDFKIYLPRVDEAPEDTKVKQGPAKLLKGNDTVLVVEDEEAVRTLICEVLGLNGYTVLEACHGREALSLSQRFEGTIHLMVTDIVMPHMSGPEVVQQISPLRPKMRVLYVSGYTDGMIGDHGGSIDTATAFLEKPFTPEALTRKVREVLKASTAARSR